MTSTDAVAKADAVAKEYFAAVNRRDFEGLANVLAPNAVFEHESPIEGRDVLISVLQGFLTAFPDLEMAVTDQISHEDEVVVFLRTSGTWQGEFAGIPPTGVTRFDHPAEMTRRRDALSRKCRAPPLRRS